MTLGSIVLSGKIVRDADLGGVGPGSNLIQDDLRGMYPDGHPEFIPKFVKLMALHSAKNHDYAAGGDPLGNFNRVSSILKLYPGFSAATPCGVALVYMLKQVDAVLWGLCRNTTFKVEGFEGRLDDITVYATLANLMIKECENERRVSERDQGGGPPRVGKPKVVEPVVEPWDRS